MRYRPVQTRLAVNVVAFGRLAVARRLLYDTIFTYIYKAFFVTVLNGLEAKTGLWVHESDVHAAFLFQFCYFLFVDFSVFGVRYLFGVFD